jgi:hypothetical protein
MIASQLLDPSVPHAAVLDAVRRSWRRFDHAQYVLCIALRRLFRDYAHRGAGYARFDDWAEDELGIPGKLAWTFSLLGRDLERLPRTREALERGEITYTKAREYARMATAEDDADWVEFARSHTNREVERRVRHVEMRSPPVKTVTSRMDVDEAQVTRAAREKLCRVLDEPVAEEKVLPRLAAMFVEERVEVAGPGRPARPYLSLQLCPSCLATWAPVPGEDVEVPLDRWLDELRDGAEVTALIESQLCDCEDMRHRRDLCPRVEPSAGEGPSGRHVPEIVRREVEARDGFRCRVPGCRESGPLELSHLVAFADGGPMTAGNVVQHCRTHNALIATGRIRVEGVAPFEHYRLADGTYLGVGHDPVPRRRPVSHVGDPPAARRLSVEASA